MRRIVIIAYFVATNTDQCAKTILPRKDRHLSRATTNIATIRPDGSIKSKLAPITAAIGSSIKKNGRQRSAFPELRRSTAVGLMAHILPLRTGKRHAAFFRIKCLIIDSGCNHPCNRTNIAGSFTKHYLCFLSTARTCVFPLTSQATTDGSSKQCPAP